MRNLYRSQAEDGQWFKFAIAVRGKNIEVAINDTAVVCYTEPAQPYRVEAYAKRLLSHGDIALRGASGKVAFRDLQITRLKDDALNPNDTLPPVDETTDKVIRYQQQNFPVIDYHVHLKGGLTKEMAHAMSMNYGINYGIAPNAGEGGVGRMLADDKEVYEYFDEVKDMPFLRDGLSKDQYMAQIVDQTVKILTNEPADIFANPTYIPDDMNPDYAKYWTDERVDKVLDVLEKYQIALEINPRYKIPSFDVIRKAKERGIKFTFGTNNVDANFGRLEYCFEAVEKCGLTAEDMWFPSMSIRRERPVVIYNKF